jgi:O-antigen ligase/polysaccharide polymerase Wzy-like membrane protein
VLVQRPFGPRVDASPAAILLALAIPFVFLHPVYQRSVTAGGVTANFTDFAILVAVVGAFVDGLRHGFGPLRGNRWVWWPLVGFCLLILASLGWARHADPEYGLKSHLTGALKFVEYAFLAAAAALVLRRDDDRRVFGWVLLAWSAFLSAVAVLQFLGVLHQFKGHRPEQREPSYIGFHDLGAFSGAALSTGFAAILLGLHRRLRWVAVPSGALGIAIAAALDSVGGMVLTAVAGAALAARRARATWGRLAAVAAICVLVAVGAVSLRSSAIKDFLRFLGVSPATKDQTRDIQTYAQRTVLAYIGLQIFVHHPVLGVGWQESSLPHSFQPYLARARARFPRAAPQSFPSRAQEWGVQNGIVQTLSDLGIVGGLVLATLVLATLRLLVRVAARGPPELLWWALADTGFLIFALAVFTGSGLLPGIPVDALLWLSIGIAVSLHNSLQEPV